MYQGIVLFMHAAPYLYGYIAKAVQFNVGLNSLVTGEEAMPEYGG